MSIVFGPVYSRRFGLSLGIDLSPALKQCNFDCVYCELSAKKAVEKQNEIVSVEAILKEVKEKIKNSKFNFLTLTANGEPSLYPHLSELIKELNLIKKDKKILILSNGTAVLDEYKFEALLNLDLVKFSLDSAVLKTFLRVDRALKDINLEQMIEKMALFAKKFKGELVMESLIVKGINDTSDEMIALNKALEKIKPKRLDLSTIDRPSAYPVKAVSEEDLENLAKHINAVPVLIAKRKSTQEKLNLDEEELLKLLCLRPQSEFDVKERFSKDLQKILANLLKDKKIYTKNLAGVLFYKA